MNIDARDLEARARRELDIACLALHLREASRAARRLGLKGPSMRAFAAMPMVLELGRLSSGVTSVPELLLEIRPHPAAKSSLSELFATVQNELLKD